MDREKVIKGLEKAKIVIEQWIPMFEQYNTPAVIDEAIALLKEQDDEIAKFCGEVARLTAMLEEQKAEIRQLKLALDIVKGTRKGISVEGW